MSKILDLREKRSKAWETAKAFLDTKRGNDGLISAEDTVTYDKMEADVVNFFYYSFNFPHIEVIFYCFQNRN